MNTYGKLTMALLAVAVAGCSDAESGFGVGGVEVPDVESSADMEIPVSSAAVESSATVEFPGSSGEESSSSAVVVVESSSDAESSSSAVESSSEAESSSSVVESSSEAESSSSLAVSSSSLDESCFEESEGKPCLYKDEYPEIYADLDEVADLDYMIAKLREIDFDVDKFLSLVKGDEKMVNGILRDWGITDRFLIKIGESISRYWRETPDLPHYDPQHTKTAK